MQVHKMVTTFHACVLIQKFSAVISPCSVQVQVPARDHPVDQSIMTYVIQSELIAMYLHHAPAYIVSQLGLKSQVHL